MLFQDPWGVRQPFRNEGVQPTGHCGTVPFWSRQASPLLGSAVEAPAGG